MRNVTFFETLSGDFGVNYTEEGIPKKVWIRENKEVNDEVFEFLYTAELDRVTRFIQFILYGENIESELDNILKS